MDYEDFLQGSLEGASRIAREKFGKLATLGETKTGDNNQVLTEADIAIGQYLVAKISEFFPNDNIIDEEAGVIDRGSARTWVVDPIDGTSNFAAGSPQYGVMVGLLEDATPIAGAVALPAFHEIYVASRGNGCQLNGVSLSVTGETRLLSALVAYGIDGYQEDPQRTRDETRELANIVLGIRNLRASNSVFDQVMVAKGVYGAYLNRTSKIWDNVAPHVIIEEAGGIYTDFFGAPLNYSSPLQRAEQNFTCCAGAPQLHAQIQNILRS